MNNEILLMVGKDIKLLGVLIGSDIKWSSNIKKKYILKKNYKLFWILRNLKVYGAN